jgi:Lrp/AsnC family leucine-responsive transcriptional regulator
MAFIQVLLTNTSTANLREFSREMMSLTDDESCHMVAGGFDFFIEDPLFRHAGLSTVF